jgi:hypothetical protein
MTWPCAAANPARASRLQSTRPVRRVAESFGIKCGAQVMGMGAREFGVIPLPSFLCHHQRRESPAERRKREKRYVRRIARQFGWEIMTE